MKKNIGVLVCMILSVLLVCPAAYSATITSEQALKAVEAWLTANPFGVSQRAASHFKAYDENGFTESVADALYYVVYLQPHGIVVVPAEDVVEPVIAFLPDATEYAADPKSPFHDIVIKDIVERVNDARRATSASRASNDEYFMKNRRKWSALLGGRAALSAKDLDSLSTPMVDPLLSSVWGQDFFYEFDENSNLTKKPVYNYYTPNNYVTGCVSTAVGQVMRYHEHPKTGIGVHTFEYYVDYKATLGGTLGGDGNGGPYKWSDMPLSPNESITVDQCRNIGALLSDIGRSISAEYTVDLTSSSLIRATQRLIGLFMYGSAIVAVKFENHNAVDIPITTLHNMINANLDAGLPILLSVERDVSGHVVVADGYGYNNGTMYHHINMGWNGSQNAWYALPEVERYNRIDTCTYNIYPTGGGEIVSGRVLDDGGRPLENATVSLSGGVEQTTTSDKNGIFAFSKLPSNASFTLTASKGGYSFKSRSVNTGQSQNPKFNNLFQVSGGGTHACGNVWGADIHGGEGEDEPIGDDSGSGNTGSSGGGGGGCNAGLARILLALCAVKISISALKAKKLGE